jgi:hypothetical protein
MIDNIAGNPTRAKIEAASQAVIKSLERKAGCHWRTCCEKLNWNLLFLDWRLGCLAHEENIETEPRASSFNVRRKEPDTSKPILIEPPPGRCQSTRAINLAMYIFPGAVP